MRGRVHVVSSIAGLVPYLVMALGAASVLAAGYVLWTNPSDPWGASWRQWLLLIIGAAALCTAVALS